jgi:FHA domain-containing protein
MGLRSDGTRPLRPIPPEDDADGAISQNNEQSEPMSAADKGAAFGKGGDVADLLAEIERRSKADTDNRSLRMTPRVNTDAQPWRVIFEAISPESKLLGVDVQDVAVVGRSDPQISGAPELDLAQFGAQSMGVSRRHAILLPGEDGLNLIDLDSTNGTWINGVYLQPGQKYPLHAGDRVEFGKLRLVVRVVGEMLQGGGDESSTGITRSKPRRK